MAEKPKHYYITAGLLYPSALGAALAWLIPAVLAGFKSHDGESTWWAILFGGWFVLYHSVWFVHLARTADSDLFKYPCHKFVSDLLDVVALFSAFLLLGLALPDTKSDPRWVYLAAALVPVSAIVDVSHRHELGAWLLLAAALVVPIMGFFIFPRANPAALVGYDWIALAVLFLLLGLYIVKPEWFGSLRAA